MFFIDLTVDRKSRFDSAKFMEIVNGAQISADSYFCEKLLELKPSGYFRVSNERHRPDLISYKIYGSTQYWWILLLYNGLMDFTDILPNLEIEYPSMADMEDIYFQLTSKALRIT